jgi:ABC-type polysaccharide/polyol phosphate transport system ATPase subunit
MTAIRFENVTKSFPLQNGRLLLRDRIRLWMGLTERKRFTALRGVSFTLEQGQSLALVGHNGAGKSTLLSMAASLVEPDSGWIEVNGRIAPILELGSGFHPDLTGSENILINSALLGFQRCEALRRRDEIIEFSGIGDFIHEPVRTYSSGMLVRLAFAVAICRDPDILIIDEVLGVGDQEFYQRCLERIVAMRRAGKALVLASHSFELLRMLTDQCLWLDHGRVVKQGPTPQVLDDYAGSLAAH